ncbi:MAG TPA: peptidase [Candidatus Bathyarchaeia archaeon]|nr:peptidase [Candidatus Bathyarchaeia archaeon]
MKNFWIFYDNKSAEAVPPVKEALNTVFGMETDEVSQLDAAEVKGAFNLKRRQYNASKLMNYLIQSTSEARSTEQFLALWIISDDLYVLGMNFVFGVAHPGKAALLSTHRLDSLDLIKKEAIHETGHVLGLQHCTNDCVMQFSNSLYEAKEKPATLCARCRTFLLVR